ncbi:hypothetical protein C4544_03945 [candidate division WS5 bacterium]|uniref:Uncharacterized protein n=1 Tax=candidate division WS5 bacterium TaxID=2093353 RepID=A0A419DCX8_9BACT|nr:MAG: hypothetical protein C4544_03945 [candidate division WS5 bacterium]
MSEIYLHGNQIESVFELLGDKENDITYSIGWAFANSPSFLNAFIKNVSGKIFNDESVVSLQEFKHGSGITDIEIRSNNYHIIIEAKRGWLTPGIGQLNQYAKRLKAVGDQHNFIVTMSACSRDYASLHLPAYIHNIPVRHFSWKDISRLTGNVLNASHAEKKLLAELRTYLRRIVNMQDQESNMVYVVSLASGTPEGYSISWIDIVEKKKRYFHPVGSGWPSNPPNYIGFRYYGMLQRIHHVESWKIVDDLHSEIKEIKKGMTGDPHYIYKLGPPIIPEKEIKTGNIFRNGRVKAMLDLLLTCNTISEARDKTQIRQNRDM